MEEANNVVCWLTLQELWQWKVARDEVLLELCGIVGDSEVEDAERRPHELPQSLEYLLHFIIV